MNSEDSLTHYGIMGMKWGKRKSTSSSISSSDHAKYAAIRKKKLVDMTDDELRSVTRRMELISKYKSAQIPRENKKKKIQEMSNEELEAGIRRGELIKEDWIVGVRKIKKISKMSDAEVAATLNRHMLEKPYKKLKKKETEAIEKIVNQLVFGTAAKVIETKYPIK